MTFPTLIAELECSDDARSHAIRQLRKTIVRSEKELQRWRRKTLPNQTLAQSIRDMKFVDKIEFHRELLKEWFPCIK